MSVDALRCPWCVEKSRSSVGMIAMTVGAILEV